MIIKTSEFLALNTRPANNRWYVTHSCYCGCSPEGKFATLDEAIAANEEFIELSFYIRNEIVAEDDLFVTFDCGQIWRKDLLEIVEPNGEGYEYLVR